MDLLDSMLPAYLHGKRTLQDYLHMSDAQWEVFIHASPEEQLVYRAKCRPQTDDELYEYIKFVWGITFPRTCHPDCAKKDIPCTAPFKVFADAFFGRYPLIILKGSRGSGKMAPLWTKLLTPTGWTTMGEIAVGDQVIDWAGNPVKVTHLHPQGVKEVYKVSFNDGTYTIVGGEHLWTAKRVGNYKSKKTGERVPRPWAVKTTLELKDDLYVGIARKDLKWRIPIVEPINLPHKQLPLDPYALGLLLGDGCFRHSTPGFTCHPKDSEIVDSLREALAFIDVDVRPTSDKKGMQYSLARKSGEKINNLTQLLSILNLKGTSSYTKFIPEEYLFSSKEQRLALLQGLCDTDGHASKSYNRAKPGHKGVEYISASSDLADAVVFLVQSLGGTAYRSIKKAKNYPDRVYHRLYIKLPVCPFRLNRKVADWTAPSLYPVTRIITSIEKCEQLEECQCITVDSPTSTYLTNDCIVTHNSVLLGLLALCEQVCMDARVLVVGASETQSKVVFNYVSVRQTKFPDMFWRSPNAPVALMNAKDELQLSSVIVTGGEILCSPASETSVLGQRPSRLRLDEADKIKKDLVEGAIPCCHPDKYRKIKNQIILSSTHYSVDGTLTEYIERANQANKEAGEVVIPVYQFCYKDVLEENEGYITPELLRDMKLSVDKHTWLRQFENGEPAVEGALFSEEDLEILFDDSLGTFDSDPKAHYEEHIVDEEKYQIYDAKKKPIYSQSYVGCDFGDKIDWTIVSKFKCDEDDAHPDVMTHWVKSGRCGLTTSVVRYNKILSLEHSVAAHDATGGTGFVSEQLTEYSEPVIFNSNWKREALTQFISAVEQHRLRLPRIPTLEKCLRYITYDECFGSKHLPDEMASLILAWWARRRILKIFNIGSIKI